MPIEFIQEPQPTGVFGDTLFRLTVAYDGTGRRISKTRWVKAQGDADWSRGHVTHYTGIGTEVRENLVNNETKVVVNMPVFFRVTLTRLKPRSYIEKDILRLSNGGAILPKQSFGASRQGLGRYGVEDLYDPITGNDGNYVPSVMPGGYYVNFNLHRVKGPAYLSTPGGHLVEYGVDNIGVLYMNVIPSS